MMNAAHVASLFGLFLVGACAAQAPEPSTTSADTTTRVPPSAEAPTETAKTPTPPPTTAPVATTPAPTTTAAPSAGPRAIPPLATSCKSDAACAVFDEDVTGDTACCPGCSWHAANKTSFQAFRAACTASPARECPALGCAMPIVGPKCVAGQCVAQTQKS